MDTPNNTSPSPNNSEAALAASDEKLRLWVQKHQQLLEVLLDAFCVVDLHNRVVDFNVAFTELCGESYRKILKIGDFCTLLKTEQCPSQCPARQVVDGPKSVRLDELSGSSKAYPTLRVILSGVPICADDGQAIGSLLTIRNVSAESELQKKYDERKAESVTDGLTRLYNKMYSEAMLLKFIKGSLRETQGLSVLLCDIDHFKKVNDTYGHQAGDYVLAMVAGLAKATSRDSDIVGRFGGEEFIIVLNNTDREGARTFAERFRERVAEKEFIFEKTTIPVHVSVGTSTFLEKWTDGSSPEVMMKDLVAKADAALYYAKANGRNQVRQFEELPENHRVAPKKEKKAS